MLLRRTSAKARRKLNLACFRAVSFAVAGAASILLASSCTAAPPPQAPLAPQVPVAIARRGTVRPSLTLAGFIAPAQSVGLSSALSEPAIEVNVQEGDRVRRGQVLAVLRTSDMRAQLEYDLHTAASNEALTEQNLYSGTLNISQGNDAVNQARANLRAAEATLANARRDLARYDQLYGRGYVTEQQYVTQQTIVETDDQAVVNARAALASAVSNVSANGTLEKGLQASKIAQSQAAAQASLDQAAQERADIALATIASPVDGIVVNRNLNVGEYPGSRQIFTLQETDYVFAMLSASSPQVFDVRSGAPVTVVPLGRRDVFSGSVVAVLDQLTPGSTNFAVKVRIPNPQGILHSGVAVSSRVALSPVTGVTIPYAAFLDDNHDTIMIVDGGNVARIVKVVLQGTDGRTAAVAGIPSGTRVVSNGQLGLSDGQKVAPK